MQFPKERDGQEEQYEVGDDVAESVVVVDVVGLDWAFSPWVELHTQDPTSLDGFAGEDGEEKGDGGPDDENGAEKPGYDAKNPVNTEDTV